MPNGKNDFIHIVKIKEFEEEICITLKDTHIIYNIVSKIAVVMDKSPLGIRDSTRP